MENLSSLLTIPWTMNPRFKEFYSSVEDLISYVKKYEEYLHNCNKKMKENHNSPAPVRYFKDNWILRVVEPVGKVTLEYGALDLFLKNMAQYQPIDLIDFEPNDKEARRKWITHLRLSNSFAFFHSNMETTLEI